MCNKDFLKAAGSGDQTAVAELIGQGIDLNLHEEEGLGRTALMKACRHGHIGIVRLLLENGARPDEQDVSGDAALAYAACNGYMEIVKLLLDRGADTRLRNKAGRTVPEEVGYELLAKHKLTDEERTEAQRQFWEFITVCKQHNPGR
ncbi:MAG: ankyrin repeat domain-containing protein [Nitrospirae bacterium]|nr:ankyrin repeat domain-containing protein [Nitrospirota bacterium]